MTAQQALELLQPIPAEDFITGDFTDYNRKCCVMGHLTRLTSGNPENYSFTNCSDFEKNPQLGNSLRTTSQNFIWEKYKSHGSIVSVNNDSTVNGYIEPVIKDRVVHLLKDMVKAGY